MEVQSQLFQVCMSVPIKMFYIFPSSPILPCKAWSNFVCNDLWHKCDRKIRNSAIIKRNKCIHAIFFSEKQISIPNIGVYFKKLHRHLYMYFLLHFYNPVLPKNNSYTSYIYILYSRVVMPETQLEWKFPPYINYLTLDLTVQGLTFYIT